MINNHTGIVFKISKQATAALAIKCGKANKQFEISTTSSFTTATSAINSTAPDRATLI